MLEPQLQKNREEFNKLHARQVRALIGGVLCVGAIAFLAPVRWIEVVETPGLVVFGIVIVAFELNKLSVFRRDIRERRGLDEGQSTLDS